MFCLLYMYFKWSFQVWKRKNVPYFEPDFPNGNRQSLHKAVPIAVDVFRLTQKAKAKGKNYYSELKRIARYIY